MIIAMAHTSLVSRSTGMGKGEEFLVGLAYE